MAPALPGPRSPPRAVQRRLGLCLTMIGLFCGFIALNESALSDQYGFIAGGWQITVGGLILPTLEMARRGQLRH